MTANQKDYPEFLLDNICWDFTAQNAFTSREEFEDAVRKYNLEAFEDDEDYNFDEEFDFQKIALIASGVIVDYYADPPEEEGHYFIEIESNDKISFSNGELFYKFHNAAIARLNESAHCYFEGFEFIETNEKGIPVYQMIGGS